MNTNEYTDINRAEFISYVRMKELVAKFVFYLLTLNLMTDITAVFLMEKSPCEANDVDEGNGNRQLPDDDLKNIDKTVYNSTE